MFFQLHVGTWISELTLIRLVYVRALIKTLL